ncbi:MAG: methylenetetrahydrofolate reductase [NAD(P)H] [Spirochaetaceae bacterium]
MSNPVQSDTHIADVFARQETTFSFEFFPPKTDEAWKRLLASMRDFELLGPSFVSITYGAGGTTRERTHELVLGIRTETNLLAVPHLTAVCHTRAEVWSMLEAYAGYGISNVMALMGDPPGEESGVDCRRGDFEHAVDLVRLVREFNAAGLHPGPRGFGIGVAGFPEGHPATPNRLRETEYLKQKVEAGADYICTQMFFDNHDFYDFAERCEVAGIDVPIIAGLMPIVSRRNYRRIPDFALGARYPAELQRRMAACTTDEEAAEVGISWTAEQASDLLEHGVRGLHLYVLNRAGVAKEVYRRVGLLPYNAADPEA